MRASKIDIPTVPCRSMASSESQKKVKVRAMLQPGSKLGWCFMCGRSVYQGQDSGTPMAPYWSKTVKNPEYRFVHYGDCANRLRLQCGYAYKSDEESA